MNIIATYPGFSTSAFGYCITQFKDYCMIEVLEADDRRRKKMIIMIITTEDYVYDLLVSNCMHHFINVL